MKKVVENIGVPLISVLMAITLGSLILVLSGLSPLILFQDLIVSSIGDANRWLMITSMLIFSGLAIGFSYRGGLFNIGAEGQFIVASLCASFFATTTTLPNAFVPIVSVIIGFIAGSIWAFLPGLLKALYGISEVVITIMLNWIAMYLFDYIVILSYHQSTNDQATPVISPAKLMTVNIGGTDWNYGIILALIFALGYWFVLNKTTFGFEVKAIGHSKEISEYTGISATKRIIQTMMISGGLAGISGSIYALSYESITTVSGNFANYGFDGIAVALLGGLNAIGTVFAGLLMAALRNAKPQLSIHRVPSEISDIIIALIIIFSIVGPILYKKLVKRGA